MFSHTIQTRVRYSETDKMGYVYYGNYTHYYEIGRVETLRSLGVEYRMMEDDLHIFLPVKSLNVRYLRPAYYDDLITIKTSILHIPDTSIQFESLLYNEKNELLNQALVQLVFVSSITKKKIIAPDFILEKLKPYFETQKKN